MTKSKSTKRALLMSALALLMCVSMLIGSTFAWFTDSVTSAGNIIQSGTLDVDLVDADNNSMAGKVIEFKTADNRDQNQILWEPGCTYETKPVFVVNNGNLALKYEIAITGITGDEKLLEAIEWTVTVGETETELAALKGTLLAGKKSDAIILSGHMKEEAGNEYQDLTVEGIAISVFATQLASESDSFGNQYDKNAGYDQGKTNVGPYALDVLSGGIAVYDEDTKTYTIDVKTVGQGGWNTAGGNNYYAGYTVNVAGYGEGATVKFNYADGSEVTWSLAEEEATGFINNGKHQMWSSVGSKFANRYDIDGDGVTDFTVVNDASNAKVEVANAEQLKKVIADEGVSAILTADITVNSTITIPKNVTATLDLNGNDLSYAVSNTGASAIITNNGDLTIVGEGKISFVAANPDMQAMPTYATNTITNESVLTIGEGVVVENGSSGGASYAVDNKGVFTLNGGTLIANRCALRIAKYNQDNVKFVMNGGLVKAQTPAWIQLPSSNPAVAPTISVEINDGTFETTKASSDANDLLYTYSYGNSHANTSVVINGGNFLGGTVSIGAGYYGDVPTLTINGGNFDYDVLQWTSDDTSTVVYSAN